MHVLFYVEPLVERENPVWKKGWVEHFVKEITSALVTEGQEESDIACIVPAALGGIAQSVLPNSRVLSIDQCELIPRFGSSALAVASGWYLKTASSEALSGMADLVRERLGNFSPTLCVTFSPAPFLKRAWPDASVLHLEYGFISRPPFPETVYFDPRGMFADSVFAAYKDDIASWDPPEEATALLADLRQRFMASKDVGDNPLARATGQAIEPFESAVLLALQFSNFYAYDANARFADQYDLLIHTLNSMPSTVAVVVCEHPEHLVLRPETVQYLSSRYPNFIWHPLFRQVYGASHYLMPFVQGVITVSSSVGLQALLWRKRLAIVGEGHLATVADTVDLKGFANLLGTTRSESDDRLLCWLLSNQHLPFRYLLNSGKLRKYLQLICGEEPAALEAARLSAGLTLDEIRLAYDAAWKDRPVTPYGTALSQDANTIVAALYVATEDRGYDEVHCIREFVSLSNGSEASLSFRLDGANAFPVALRFDPANRPCTTWLRSVVLADRNGKKLWTWSGEESGVRNCHGLEFISQKGAVLAICYDHDPQFELAIDFNTLGSSPRPLILSVNMAQSTPKETAEVISGSLSALAGSIAEKNTQVAQLYDVVTERDSQIADLNQAVVERDSAVADLNLALVGRDGQIESLKQTILERNSKIADLNLAVVERDSQIEDLNRVVAERDSRLANQDRYLAELPGNGHWLFVNSIRYLQRKMISSPSLLIRKFLSDSARDVWRNFPLAVEKKQRLKNLLFAKVPILFRHTLAYRSWQSFQHTITNAKCDQVDGPKIGDSTRGPFSKYVPLLVGRPLEHKPVKLIAFYLPQFHPIPENDVWWGDGFTEWTNVQPAQPQFAGHYQPHVPGELGYYNLLDPGVQRRQVELAKLYGIGGFCFYFYWFGGKRLLEAPVENYLNDRNLELPFCLCWANENWSRRWDGLDNEVLIGQQHSAEDDIAFVQHVARYMRDPRYIRIDGKPLLLVYRPGLLPSAQQTSMRWRRWCSDNGIGDIYLAYTQSFDTVDPATYGFDAAIEFPPNNSAPPIITNSVVPLADNFGGIVYDWRVFVERSEHYSPPDYSLFRSVCPSWDNTARRKNGGAVFLNSSPSLYQRWLENAIADTLNQRPNPDERLVFVNAWNEWAEGAHLEPDALYGYAWLQATRNAMSGETHIPDNERKLVLVAHDAYPHGAQMLAANLAKTLNLGMGFRIDLVCLDGGPLVSEYGKWATVHSLAGRNPRGSEAKALARRLYETGHRTALINTTVSGLFLETLVEHGISCVALIHELRGVLKQYQLDGHARAIATHATKVVFPAAEVAESFNDIAPLPFNKQVIRPQGLYKRRDKSRSGASDCVQLRRTLGLATDTQVVLGVGYADYRKGIDLFVAAGMAMAKRLPKARWVWIGHWEQTMQHAVERQFAASPELRDRFVFAGLQEDTDLFYGGADVFALTSREDPFPSVVLEALDAGVPVVGFAGAGGFTRLLEEGCGRLVPMEDCESLALAVGDLLENPSEKEALGQRGLSIVDTRFSFRRYVFDLLDLLGIGLARVSAVVPNYNYEHYLAERLESIVEQDYPIYEIIFLDDCSKDGSIALAEDILRRSGIDFKFVANRQNSGSVFRQWCKGVELTSGSHVWLAEADDSCDDGLISELLKGFVTPGVVLSYCESKQIDENGLILADNYHVYVSDVDARHWLTSFIRDGVREIANALSIKNTIPNVSAVLFERSAIHAVLNNNLDVICSYRIAGDWITYVHVLDGGRVAFSPKSLNRHRRHQNGLTIRNINKSQIEEIRRAQLYIAEYHDVPSERLEQAERYIEALHKEHGVALHSGDGPCSSMRSILRSP